MLRVHRIPYSTNVERVALAAAHKGLDVVWVDHHAGDRSLVRELSGQDLVPVLELDGEVVADSMRIVERLETLAPEPALYPREPVLRARVRVFVEWFNEVWKGPPNEIEAELRSGSPDAERVELLARQMNASLDLFESLLDGRDYLLGEFSAADCAAFPFLKYAIFDDPADTELFHRVLVDHLRLDGSYPRLRAWIERVDARPRA